MTVYCVMFSVNHEDQPQLDSIYADYDKAQSKLAELREFGLTGFYVEEFEVIE
jgi:hypothetical protein